MAMTVNVRRFVRFNQKHAVVSGYANEDGKGGGGYTLANRMSFTFTRDECRSMPEGFPDWKIEGAK
jgi:hypothetical protein